VERTLKIPGYYEENVALSPDGALLAVATVYPDPQLPGDTIERLGFGSPRLLVWNAKTGDLIIERKMSKLVTSLAFSPDSKTLATCTYEGVILRDPKTLREKGKLQPSTGPPRPVQLAFSANGTRMAIAANDNKKKQGFLTFWKLNLSR